MLIFRALFIFTVIALGVFLVVYLLSGDKRYLRLVLQIMRLGVVLCLIIGLLWAAGRIILY